MLGPTLAPTWTAIPPPHLAVLRPAPLQYVMTHLGVGPRWILEGITVAQALRVLVVGAMGRREEVPLDALRAQNEDLARMFERFQEVGHSADIDRLPNEHPDVP